MNRILKSSILLLGFFFAFSAAFAQEEELSRKERRKLRKKWKKEAKEYKRNPLELKEKMDNMNAKMKTLEEEKAEYRKELNACEGEKAALKDSIANLMLKISPEGKSNQDATMQGLSMKVQIGAYKEFKPNVQFDGKELEAVRMKNGVIRYQIGEFVNLEQAKTFVGDLKRMGIKDAWVVPYVDGEFVPIEELEEMLEKQGKLPNN